MNTGPGKQVHRIAQNCIHHALAEGCLWRLLRRSLSSSRTCLAAHSHHCCPIACRFPVCFPPRAGAHKSAHSIAPLWTLIPLRCDTHRSLRSLPPLKSSLGPLSKRLYCASVDQVCASILARATPLGVASSLCLSLSSACRGRRFHASIFPHNAPFLHRLSSSQNNARAPSHSLPLQQQQSDSLTTLHTTAQEAKDDKIQLTQQQFKPLSLSISNRDLGSLLPSERFNLSHRIAPNSFPTATKYYE